MCAGLSHTAELVSLHLGFAGLRTVAPLATHCPSLLALDLTANKLSEVGPLRPLASTLRSLCLQVQQRPCSERLDAVTTFVIRSESSMHQMKNVTLLYVMLHSGCDATALHQAESVIGSAFAIAAGERTVDAWSSHCAGRAGGAAAGQQPPDKPSW